jgi:hypothetical protein
MCYSSHIQFLICIAQILYFERYKFFIFLCLLLNTHIGSLNLGPSFVWGHKLLSGK